MIIRLASDSGDQQYDIFFEFDFEKFLPVEARTEIERAVRTVKEKFPGEYQFEDLTDELPEGIRPAGILTANEEW